MRFCSLCHPAGGLFLPAALVATNASAQSAQGTCEVYAAGDFEIGIRLPDEMSSRTVSVYNVATGLLVDSRTVSPTVFISGTGCNWVAHVGEPVPGTRPAVGMDANTLYRIDLGPGESYYYSLDFSGGFFSHRNAGFPDLLFIGVDNVSPLRVYPTQLGGGAAGRDVADFFPDGHWVLPYDLPTICASTGCNGEEDSNYIFLTPASTTTPLSLPITVRAATGADWRVPAGRTLNWLSSEVSAVRFGASGRLTVKGTLNATGTLLTSTGATTGWGGVRYEAGSGGTLSGVTVERVSGYGAAAVRVTNASPSFSNVVIQRSSSLGSAVTGLVVSGAQAAPTAHVLTVQDMTAGGVVVDNGADLRMTNSFLTGNIGAGLTAGYQSEVFLYPALVGSDATRTRGVQISGSLGSGGNGVTAHSSGDVVFGYAYNPPPGPSYHLNGFGSSTGNAGRGLAASGASVLYAGGSALWQRNRLFSNAANDAEATGNGTAAYVRCDWWNDTTPPFRTAATAGATLDASRWLVQDPYANPVAECTDGSIIDGFGRAAVGVTAARGAVDLPALTLVDRIAAAIEQEPGAAFAVLTAIIAEGSDAPEAAAAVTQIARLAEGDRAPAGAESFLAAAASAPGRLRSAARRGLLGVRHAAGDVDGALAVADALAAGEIDDALAGQVARVYLLSEQGRTDEALSALAAVETLAPGSSEVWLARTHLGLPVEGQPEGGRAAPWEAASQEGTKSLSGALSVGEAYPNPATDRASVTLTLTEPTSVRVVVIDALGREVADVLDEDMGEGAHQARIAVNRLAPGAYLVRVTAGAMVETRRLVVAR